MLSLALLALCASVLRRSLVVHLLPKGLYSGACALDLGKVVTARSEPREVRLT